MTPAISIHGDLKFLWMIGPKQLLTSLEAGSGTKDIGGQRKASRLNPLIKFGTDAGRLEPANNFTVFNSKDIRHHNHVTFHSLHFGNVDYFTGTVP